MTGIKLTHTQLVLMSAAAQREDRCLVASQKLRGNAASKVAAKLIEAGYAKKIRAKGGLPLWRRDQGGEAFALKLTAAGLKAIHAEADEELPASRRRHNGEKPMRVDRSRLTKVCRRLRSVGCARRRIAGLQPRMFLSAARLPAH